MFRYTSEYYARPAWHIIRYDSYVQREILRLINGSGGGGNFSFNSLSAFPNSIGDSDLLVIGDSGTGIAYKTTVGDLAAYIGSGGGIPTFQQVTTSGNLTNQVFRSIDGDGNYQNYYSNGVIGFLPDDTPYYKMGDGTIFGSGGGGGLQFTDYSGIPYCTIDPSTSSMVIPSIGTTGATSFSIYTNSNNRIVFGANGSWTIGGGTGTAGQVLMSLGSTTSPVWSNLSANSLQSVTTGTGFNQTSNSIWITDDNGSLPNTDCLWMRFDTNLGRALIEYNTGTSTMSSIRLNGNSVGITGDGISEAQIKTDNLTANRILQAPNIAGSLLVDSQIKWGQTPFTVSSGQTVYQIPHGLGTTPSSFAITFKDATDTNFFQSVRTIDATNITITCTTPPLGIPSSNIIYWQVFR